MFYTSILHHHFNNKLLIFKLQFLVKFTFFEAEEKQVSDQLQTITLISYISKKI